MFAKVQEEKRFKLILYVMYIVSLFPVNIPLIVDEVVSQIFGVIKETCGAGNVQFLFDL